MESLRLVSGMGLGPCTPAVQMLNEPAKRSGGFYKATRENVFIRYASGPPCGTEIESAWQVPRIPLLRWKSTIPMNDYYRI
jgi:hypothetical protein